MVRKRISLLRRRTDRTRTQFDAHWSGPHVPIIKRLPGLRGYVQNHAIGRGDTSPAIDGIVEVWYDDAVVAAPSSHYLGEQLLDELRFLSALTGFGTERAELYDAQFKVWALVPEVGIDADLDASPYRAVVDTRDAATEVVRREALDSEPEPPGTLVAFCFESADLANAALADIRDVIDRPQARFLITRSLRIL